MMVRFALSLLLAGSASASIFDGPGYCNWSNCNGEIAGGWCDIDAEKCESYCGGTWCPPPGYCNWSNCNGEIAGGWCDIDADKCESYCGGTWCTNGNADPVPASTPAPTPAPTPNPVPAPMPTGPGYCNWSNCDGEPAGGDWCNIDSNNCVIGCSGTWCATPSPTSPSTGFSYNATHGEDSRLIAYVGNWQTCPTAEQTDAYSHLVIAFATSYVWSQSGNICDQDCNITSTVPICDNANNQALVDEWRAAGKKVILSFGGAGMGGSWEGDLNNCWDYCFGKEEQVSNALVSIIDAQNFDGIDIDYEYCYDIAGKQAGQCTQRTNSYSDAGAQNFLNELTAKMRLKLDALQLSNGYNRGRYEVTHAPMDGDLTPTSSEYFKILRNRRADLDFLMPQFYNGVTRPAYGIDGSGGGNMAVVDLYRSLSNDLFDMQPNKVVFGHCISDCGDSGSNIDAATAAQVTADMKTHDDGEFACNGGAFFWVALDDVGGEWSDAVVAEVSKTAGCSGGTVPTRRSLRNVMPPATPPATPNLAGPSPTSPVAGGMYCADGETKMKAYNACEQYYQCLYGEVKGTLIDAPGYLFDEVIQKWNVPGSFDCQVVPVVANA